jgi:hypothetical protein
MSRTHAPRTHQARTDARRKPGTTRQVAEVSGTGGLRFRAFAAISRPERYGCRGTANAVGLYGPPGFKSPILRSDQAFRLIRGGRETPEMPSGTPRTHRRSRPAASPGAEDAGRGSARDAGQPADPGLDQAGLGGGPDHLITPAVHGTVVSRARAPIGGLPG